MARFTSRDVPDQTGRRIIVTGANSGTGFETARVLAARGADLVLAVRNPGKGEAARAAILRETPAATVRVEQLDLASQVSVAGAAARLLAEGRPIHVLINNAGVMALPTRQESPDGHELQLATNVLGHFALTARLLPLLQAGQARVVQLSSVAHRQGRIHLDDLNLTSGYTPWKAYAQSKLAMLMFALELDRRSAAANWGLTSVAAHPGYARTDLIGNGPLASASGLARAGFRYVYRPFLEPLVSHSQADGALPILLAATGPVESGGYYGPVRMKEYKGPPGPARIEPRALDAGVAHALWGEAERLSGVRFG
ncbi:MAG TPA: SDR family oxidoreductase [Brevundimonas sp.]|jgi:NAD(P)-dependent dehydrogenase (short-subunit alcohol dehydrogenase family)|uniref:SDR family oxidoreductase n=1 Tax=Brevundimonas sp. TaxID=1871086 RepID=UPI002E0F7C9E|nr:SDR family oxidoreductase [Brevundimonas sp.]